MSIYNQVEEIARRSSFGFGGMYLEVPAGQKLYGVMPGDQVKARATVEYRGPRLDDNFYAAIGVWYGISWPIDIGFFDEIWANNKAVRFEASNDWVTYDLEVNITITEIGLLPWTPGWFDLYAKISGKGIFSLRYDNVIEVVLKSEFRSFEIVSYEKV